MSKLSALFTTALLLSFMLAAACLEPELTGISWAENQLEDVEAKVDIESCKGVNSEECLKRRTLQAHLDYIYTQETKP